MPVSQKLSIFNEKNLAATQVEREHRHHHIQGPLAVFMYPLKAPETKREWPRRPNMFLEFLGLEGTIEQKAEQFFIKAKHKTIYFDL